MLRDAEHRRHLLEHEVLGDGDGRIPRRVGGALLVSGDMAEHAVDHGPDCLQRRPAAAEAGLHGLHLGHGLPMASARGQVGDHAFEQGFELAKGHAHQRDAALVEEQLPVPDSVARDQGPAGRDGHVIEPERGLPARAQTHRRAPLDRHARIAALHDDDHHILPDRVASVDQEEIGPHPDADRALLPAQDVVVPLKGHDGLERERIGSLRPAEAPEPLAPDHGRDVAMDELGPPRPQELLRDRLLNADGERQRQLVGQVGQLPQVLAPAVPVGTAAADRVRQRRSQDPGRGELGEDGAVEGLDFAVAPARAWIDVLTDDGSQCRAVREARPRRRRFVPVRDTVRPRCHASPCHRPSEAHGRRPASTQMPAPRS